MMWSNPLTPKGRKILAAMKREYGPKRGTQIFYASRNKGTIMGVDENPLSEEGGSLFLLGTTALVLGTVVGCIYRRARSA
jgi:hypothetical protein